MARRSECLLLSRQCAYHPAVDSKRDSLLLALSRLIVPGAEDETAFLARIDGALSILPPASRHDVEQAMSLFDHPLTGLLIIGSLRRFSSSPSELQSRRLIAFQRSSLTLFRTVYLALQRLIISAYYADLDVQRGLGYEVPSWP